MATVVIEVHSLNKLQITKENTPYLYHLYREFGIGEIKPSFGYDIQTCFWTGTYPETNNHFAKYEYHKEKDRFRLTNLLPNKLRILNYNAIKYLKGHDFFTTLSGEKKTRHFQIAREHHFFHPGAFGVKTLFDVLRENNRSFLFYQWPIIATKDHFRLKFYPKLDDSRIAEKFIELARTQYDFYFVHLRDLDFLSHSKGPYAEATKEKLKIIDSSIEKIMSNFSLESDNIFILSYFGMVEVKGTIDIQKMLPRFGRGYHYFIDSTIARFWFYDNRTRSEVFSILENISEGKLLSDEDKEKYRIRFKDSRHGEEFFVLRPGYIFSPCFFTSTPLKGAHCYDLSNSTDEEYGICLTNTLASKKANLVDFFPTIIELMKLPNQNSDGKSLLS